MEIVVYAHPNAKHARVEQRGNVFHAYINQPPVDNKATLAIIKLLAGHFKVSKQRIVLVKGFKSKTKLFKIYTQD